MDYSEAAFRPATGGPSFYTAVEETQRDIRQSSFKAILNQEVEYVPGIVPQAQGQDVSVNRLRDVKDSLEKDTLATEPRPP